MINLYPYRTIPILYICFDKFCVRPHRQLSRKFAAKHYNLQSFLSHLLKSVCKISGNLCIYQILVAIGYKIKRKLTIFIPIPPSPM